MRLEELADDAVAEIAARMSLDAQRWLALVNVIGLARMGEPIDNQLLARVLGLVREDGEADVERLLRLEQEFVQVTSDLQVCITPRADLRLVPRTGPV